MLKMINIKEQLVKHLEDVIPENSDLPLLEIPSDSDYGDFALPCFAFSKILKKNPTVIAQELVEKIVLPENIREAKVVGPYINFYLDITKITELTLDEISRDGRDYGRSNRGEGKFVITEYSSPNFGKPMHVGHIRSTILGDVLSKILTKDGYKVHRMNYFGDTGLHMGKLLTAIKKWGDSEKIAQDPEKEMLDLYVKFGSVEKEQSEELERRIEEDVYGTIATDEEPEILEQARINLKKLENGDPELTKQWKQIKEWSLIAFNRVYDLLNVEYDEIVGQSEFTERGKEVIKEAQKKNLVYEDSNNALIFDLRDYDLPDKVVLKGDGSALYSTQDLGTAHYRHDKYGFDRSIYVVATEQDIYFQQLFKMFEALGNDWAKNCEHFSFGMLFLEEGKMSTREGTVILLEEVLNKSINLAKEEIEKRNPDLENKEEVARQIGIGAIKYMILNVAPDKNIKFSWDRALNFEGDSAPYMQYSYARANSILEKAGSIPTSYNIDLISSESEHNLIKTMFRFPEVIRDSADNFKIHILANYAHELANSFNQFYKNVSVLNAENDELRDTRLFLVNSYKTVMEETLDLLGIEAPKKM